MQTEYIKRVPRFSADVDRLLEEYNDNVADKMQDVTDRNAVLVQKRFHVIDRHKADPVVDRLPYTASLLERIKNIIEFNSLTYRIVMPNTCYNWHKDWGKLCVHIPLITNDGCLFVYETRSFKMPADGSAYLVNNDRMHTFANSGKQARLHITIEKLGTRPKQDVQHPT